MLQTMFANQASYEKDTRPGRRKLFLGIIENIVPRSKLKPRLSRLIPRRATVVCRWACCTVSGFQRHKDKITPRAFTLQIGLFPGIFVPASDPHR